MFRPRLSIIYLNWPISAVYIMLERVNVAVPSSLFGKVYFLRMQKIFKVWVCFVKWKMWWVRTYQSPKCKVSYRPSLIMLIFFLSQTRLMILVGDNSVHTVTLKHVCNIRVCLGVSGNLDTFLSCGLLSNKMLKTIYFLVKAEKSSLFANYCRNP